MASRDRRRLRWTVSLVAVLLVPGGLLGAWGFLRFGGGIEEQQRAEREGAELALEELGTELSRNLNDLGEGDPGVFSIVLDGDGLPAFPFVEPPAGTWPPPDLGLALDTGLAVLARGDAEAALPFFRNAAGEDPAALPPVGVLGMARCLHACGESGEALGLLETAVDLQDVAWIDDLPFPTLAALLELRIALEIGDRDRSEAIQQALLGGAMLLPPRAAPAVLTRIPHAEPRAVEDLLRAASVAASLGLAPRGRDPRPGTEGSVLLPRDGLLLVLAPWRIEELSTQVAGQIGLRYPSLDVGLVDPGLELDTDLLASAPFAPFGRALYARPAGPLGSERTAGLAQVLVFAALGSFVLGNLLLFGLARRELDLTRMRSNFIDLVSHELRTPLTSLTMKAEMLARGDVPEGKVGDYQRTLHTEAEELSGLVQRVLDFARLQKARLPLEPARTSARGLLATALRAGRPALRIGGQKVRVEAPRGLPDLWVDREVMTRALRNLLENAARYSPVGSLVELRAAAQGPRLQLIVSDRGPGLRGDVRSLFEPFQRGDVEPPGSGLGLAIVKQAVEAHGGSVSAVNRDTGGAEFRIELPLARRAS